MFGACVGIIRAAFLRPGSYEVMRGTAYAGRLQVQHVRSIAWVKYGHGPWFAESCNPLALHNAFLCCVVRCWGKYANACLMTILSLVVGYWRVTTITCRYVSVVFLFSVRKSFHFDQFDHQYHVLKWIFYMLFTIVWRHTVNLTIFVRQDFINLWSDLCINFLTS